MNIQEVIHQYFPESAHTSFKQYREGAINLTYHFTVEENGEKKEYKLQRMNLIFEPSLMEDLKFMTEYLASRKILAPMVVRTLEGGLFVKDGLSWWRVLTYLPGRTFSAMTFSDQARDAGRLVGEFHNALLDCDYKFKFKLPHYRDADFFMTELRRTLEANEGTKQYAELKDLAEDILLSYGKIYEKIILPERIIHGDLKISNVLFSEDGKKAVALIDFDTFMHSTIQVELGDALRSWCMSGGEDVEIVEFNKSIYDATLEGYYSTAKFLTEEEKKSIPHGVELLTLELAARFIIDAFDESYFTLDASKYPNLFEQNKKRAENQFAFFKEFSKVF